ncbi:MAG: hypothetical protein NVS2B6_05970 [Thermoleophilaceae bacterium]
MNSTLKRMVICMVLVFALGAVTPTFAGAQAGNHHHPTHAKKKKKKAPRKGRRGPRGAAGPQGQGGLRGLTGPAGPIGPAGTFRAVAFMARKTTDTLEPIKTRNFLLTYGHPSTGIYCLTPTGGIDPTTSSAQVSVEWGNSLGSSLAAFIQDQGSYSGTSDCTASQFEVRTYDLSGSLTDNVAFFLLIP